MFSFFKKKKDNDIEKEEFPLEIKENTIQETKSFFSKALEKTFETIKTVVPQKKEKISFDDIQELLIEADMEYEIIEKAMNGLPSEITRKQLEEKIELRIGNEVTILGIKSKIVELVFTLIDNFEPIEKSVKIFSDFDTSENNCVLTVFLEEIE